VIQAFRVLKKYHQKNLLNSSSVPKMIDFSSRSMQHEAVLFDILPVHITDSNAVFA
jgi:hypothetical protein